MDEVMVGAMKSPKTFTGRDIIETITHGGIAVTTPTLQLAIRLTQLKLSDIIRAKTDKANIAVKQLTDPV